MKHGPRDDRLDMASRLGALTQLFARPATPSGNSGLCHLCGEERDDLDDSDLCASCAMMVW